MNSAAQRIGHWLEDDTHRYAAITVSMIMLVAFFSVLSYFAGERAAREQIAELVERLSDREYRLIQQVDCDVSEILETVAPDPKRKRLERCRK